MRTTAFFRSHQLPFQTSSEGMSNETFPFLFCQGQAETILESSTDQPGSRSRSSSISDAHAAHSMAIKKKSMNGSWLSPVKSKETKNGRIGKQKKPAEEKKKGNGEEPPLGCIHVRARRGQATDSHSLAERVRREKISERMKVLQGLVPGCEKVVGKASMLDEIINYVQSLQNQVEFLSMKLACVNPMLFDAVDYDCLINQFEFEVVGSMPQATQPQLSSLFHASIIHPTAVDQGTPKAYEPIINSHPPLMQRQGPIPLSQENGSLFMQVGDQRSQGVINYIEPSNMCTFQ